MDLMLIVKVFRDYQINPEVEIKKEYFQIILMDLKINQNRTASKYTSNNQR